MLFRSSDRRTPNYDRESLAAFISSGHFAAGRTPYAGVRLAPPRGRVSITPDGCRVTSVDALLDDMGAGSAPPDDATFDSMTERLLEIATQIGEFGGPIEMGLSGGKDSRVLAAALARAGVEFRLRTGGGEDHPDVVGARRVARALGMTRDHVVTGPSGGPRPDTLEVDLLQRTCGTLFRNDGMLNAWGSFAFRQQVAPARQVIGQGGEFYRGGWLKNPVNRDGLTPDGARSMLYTKLFRPEPLLRPDARAWYDEFLSSLLVHNDDNLGLQGRMERAFLYTYGWHWAPPGYSRSVVGEHRYYPYCDTQLLRMNYQLPVHARLHEEPHYNLLVRLNEELAYLPFTKYRWGFESYEPTAARRPDTWAERAAIQKTPADKVNWQKTVGLGELREEVETVLFGQEAQNGLFEVIDRAQLEKVFYSREVYASPNTRMLWNLYAASVMLSNQWVQLDPPSRPVHVRTDANWHQVANVALRTFQQTAEWWVDYFQRRAQAWEETMDDKELPPEKVAERAETFFGRALEAASERVAERLSSRLGNLEEYTNVDIGTYRPFLANIDLGATGMTAADLLDEDGKDRFAAAIRGDGLDGGALLERLAGDDDFVDLDAEGPVGLGPLVAYPKVTRQVVSSFGLRS